MCIHNNMRVLLYYSDIWTHWVVSNIWKIVKYGEIGFEEMKLKEMDFSIKKRLFQNGCNEFKSPMVAQSGVCILESHFVSLNWLVEEKKVQGFVQKSDTIYSTETEGPLVIRNKSLAGLGTSLI